MKKSLAILVALVLASVALLPTGTASAAEITYLSVSGSWRDPVDNLPGSQPGDPVITNGVPTSSISWGTTSGSQSGYDFTATLPPPFTLPGTIPFFSLGEFTHRNFEVGDPSLVSVELDVVLLLAVDGVETGPLTFSFTFNHEETPNNQDPCPYPTPPGEGCTDRVTIVASAEPTTFNVDGVDYTLSMSFLDNGQPVSEFITRESDTVNSSGLVGDFTLPPGLTVSKSGPATMRLAEWGEFVIGVQNATQADAYNVTLVDRLPEVPTGGMCDTTPEVLSARVFESDGVTPVPGKGPLVEGTDYSLAWDGDTTLTAPSVIGGDARLMITYRTQLDVDTEDGTALTNVAGATEWFNDDASNPGRIVYRRNLTDGTPGIGDHEDAHTVTADLPELRFEKTVINVTTGEDPATVATPGDTLRYRLYVENLGDVPVSDFRLVDELDDLNDPPAYAPGTLEVIAAPAGADAANTDPAGGAAGTGLLDIGNLDIGGLGETLLVEYEVDLAPVLADGRIVYNQAELLTGGIPIAVSDDPNVNGQADPDVAGDEDPTQVAIESAPYLNVDKISSYVTGDPSVLLAGETLRYTITVKNTGTDNATGTVLRDDVPANTAYVAGSTTLNGAAVPDPAAGESPLVAGIPINAPEDATPGALRADATQTADNVATIVFDVLVDPDVIDGTIISNQAFVSAPDQGINDQPSDDPRTSVPDDPTRDVVGNFPLLFAPKSAALQVDAGTPGIVDPGDVLRYTIAIYNNGALPATMASLTDAVPANTTYVADTLTLNGLPVGQPDGGVFPLAGGIPVSSADLTPPLPAADEGTISGGESAIVQFDLRVDDGVPPGTIISNQAVVGTYERPDLLTDGDGNPATGPEPTIVVVGDAQQLAISKQVAVVGGGAAEAGATLEYLVTVRNVAAVPAYFVEILDNLDEPEPGQLIYVDGSATMNGQANGLSFAGTTLTADYSSIYGPLQPGEAIQLRFRAVIEPTLPIGTRITNVARVYWNDPQQTASASVSLDVGGMPGTGALNGSVWHDTDFDDAADDAERRLQGWSVELYLDGERVHGTETDEDGDWRMAGLPPNYLTDMQYALVFSAPGAGPSTAALGLADSDFTNYLQRIDNIVLNPGNNLLDLNLPIDPNGVVYNALARTPIAGAVVTLVDANGGMPLPSSCFDDPRQQDQVTPADGWYKFVLNFSEPACAGGGDYVIRVAPPGAGYEARESELIPAVSNADTPPFDVPACPGSGEDAIPATGQHCEVQASAQAPGGGVSEAAGGAAYHSHLALDDTALPGTGEIFNNHIPVDPVLDGVVTVTKTTPVVDVTRGQLVPYVITVRNSIEIEVQDVTIVDRMPAGFRYVEGSAQFDGVPVEPLVNGTELAWPGRVLDASGSHTLKLLLAVGAGVSEGEFVNRAQALSSVSGAALSGEATATVRLVPDPTFDCTDVTGKVFDDHNRNGYQDGDEGGLAGVRLVTARGLAATTDNYGRFHFTCAITPHEDRGSNFAVKLDDRTLPSGYRMSTRVVQVQRATRGKALRFNFGASIHRVVGLDIAGAAFEPDSVAIRRQWQPRLDLLMEELKKGPAVLRLSYLADLERPSLVQRRLDAVKTQVETAWTELDCCYELVVEPEIFWRLGKPADTPDEPEEAGK